MKHISILAILFLPLLVFFTTFSGLTTGMAQMPAVSSLDFLPGDEPIEAAAVNQLAPAIASGNENLLAVWSDRRSSPPDAGSEYETANDIYGMRLDADGNPLDSVPFVITQAPGNQDRPQVSWNGTNWLVVFETTTLSGTGGYYEASLAAIRVSADGLVLDSTPILLLNSVPNIGTWAVASDGVGWVVAFQGSAASQDIQAVRILANGQILQPPVSLLPETYFLRFHLHLAYADGVFLLTWADSSHTLGLRFDSELNVLDAEPLLIAANTATSALASNGSQFYVVWHEQQPDFSMAVKGTRIDSNGIKLDRAGDNISGAHSPAMDTITSVSWDGINWQVSWGYDNAVSIARINTEGQVLDPGGISVNGPKTGLSAGDGTGGIHLIWSASITDQSDILSTHISAAQIAGPERILSTGAHMQLYADFAVGSNGYMAVYRSDTARAHRIHVHPLDASGNPLTLEPIQLESGDTIYGPGQPSAAWNGSLYLVTWNNLSGIVGQRVLQNGTLVDAEPFLIIPAGIGPTDVAAVGDTFLVMGRKYGAYPQYLYPVAARVRGSDGAVLDTPPLYVGESYARSVAVTSFGDRWLTVWFSAYTHDETVGSAAGNFVNADGTMGTSFSIYGPYSMGGNGIIDLTAASNGSNALVVLPAEATSGVETDLLGQIINADGSIQSTQNLTPWKGNQYRPHAAWDGEQYVIAYTDQKNRTTDIALDNLDARGDLFGMRISSEGTKIDPQGFVFSALPMAETHPNVIAANGVSLFSGSVMRNEAPYAAHRVGFTRMGVTGNQWPVATAFSNVTDGDIPLLVQFSSTGSDDPDGSVTRLHWDFGDGNTSENANPEHLFTSPGNYMVKLVVTDNDGAATTQILAVTVTAPNQLPIATIQVSTRGGEAPLDVTFSARGSYDPDGRLGNFHWIFGDGTDSWGPLGYQTFYTPGVYDVTLIAYDGRGGFGTDTITIYVGQPNQPPVAVASASILSGSTPNAVRFSSASSYDPDGTLVSTLWDFGDGSTSTLANPIHTYTHYGAYQATLTVMDNLGVSQSDTLTLTMRGENTLFLPVLFSQH